MVKSCLFGLISQMKLKTSTVFFLLLLKFCFVFSNKTEGSTCELKDGSEGVCLRLTQCDQALQDMKDFIFPNFCSFNLWKPTVCCLDCQPFIEQTLKPRYVSAYLLEGYGTVNDKCLEPFYNPFPCNNISYYRNLDDSVTCFQNQRQTTHFHVVAGGYDAHRNEYPHMALIGYGDDRQKAKWMCGGSVISDRYILTAAHCISSPSLGVIRYAALGILRRTDNLNLWQIYDISKIIAHPNYNPPSKYHDIALLATKAKIRYNMEVIPACLDRRGNLPKVAKATGWGTMGHRQQLAEHLQVVDLLKLTDAECLEAYPKHRHLKNGYDSATQVCYGDDEQINDTCEGDSGGPLQVKMDSKKISKCLYMIIGVTSYGKACGFVGSAGMYTRVSYYIPWIESITGKLI